MTDDPQPLTGRPRTWMGVPIWETFKLGVMIGAVSFVIAVLLNLTGVTG